MKKVVIIDAGGSLSKYVIETVKNMRDVQLSLFVRNKSRLQLSATNGADVFEGEAMNYNVVKAAVANLNSGLASLPMSSGC